MREKIERIAESLKKDVVNFLCDIISIPSLSGKEEAVIQRIKAEMTKLGYQKIRIDSMGNLMGSLGSGKRLIAIDGHCDTVDVGNRDTWEHNPFSAIYRDGIIYGRGACDQKGGLAAAVYAGKILLETGLPPDVSVLVTASVLEEDFEGLSWRYILNEGKITPEAVLLTEPSNLQIKIGQRGRMEMKVKTRGISCHGSAPERGENAIYKLAAIIKDIEQLNEKLQSSSILGKGTIAATDVSSTAPSLCAVADSAVLHLDRRLTEGETMDSAVRQVMGLPSVEAVNASVTVPGYNVRSYTDLDYPIRAYYPMWLMERDHPLVQCTQRAYRKQFSRDAGVGVWDFSTNGVETKGVFGIPTIGFGPGREEFAHTPNDQVSESHLLEAMKFYAAFVHAFSI